jgi:demethylmenaquinone methyltransferase/2-methoxy-6-polyprenyl-1,4-benzoquinol methylase
LASSDLERKPAGESRLALVERFFSGTAGSYDFIVRATTVGADRRWKIRIVDAIPPSAERILDLASGTGILTFAIAERFPRARIVGVELRDEYLQVARRHARERRIDNVEFVLGRAEDYVTDRSFDAIVSSYLAKYADLEILARNGRAMLRKGGLLLMHDFTYPSTARTERWWRLQFGVIRPVFGTLFPAWREAFDGLPRLIEETRWVPELESALRANGFSDVRTEELSAHGATMVSARA